jgi:hypothetical protein
LEIVNVRIDGQLCMAGWCRHCYSACMLVRASACCSTRRFNAPECHRCCLWLLAVTRSFELYLSYFSVSQLLNPRVGSILLLVSCVLKLWRHSSDAWPLTQQSRASGRQPGVLRSRRVALCNSSWGTPTRYPINRTHHWLGSWPLMSETTECSKWEMFRQLALLLHNR